MDMTNYDFSELLEKVMIGMGVDNYRWVLRVILLLTTYNYLFMGPSVEQVNRLIFHKVWPIDQSHLNGEIITDFYRQTIFKMSQRSFL